VEKKMEMDQFVELAVAVLRSLPREMDVVTAQGWIENQAALVKSLRETLTHQEIASTTCWRVEWTRFYQEVFGLNVDLSGVAISEEKPGFGWVVIVANELTLNQVWAKCKEKFPSCSYLGDDLGEVVPVNDRTTGVAYAKRFRDRVEADAELANLSANQLKKKRIQSITLPERLLLELWYLWKTGKHLDIKNITLCAGSRYSDGVVPCVSWGGDELRVVYCDADSWGGYLRARAAV
jgi:hypothetical protein